MEQKTPQISTGRETVKAFVIFGALLVGVAGLAGRLAFSDLSRMVLARQLDLGREEAQRIAEAVTSVGRRQGGIDFYRLRKAKGVLESVINERLSERSFVRHVEVRDRFGARLLFVARNEGRGGSPLLAPVAPGTTTWPASDERVVAVELRRGSHPEGEVLVGISDEAIQQELDQLRRSLMIKVLVAGAIAVGILGTGLFYVLRLVKRNRRLEQEREAANRRAHVAVLGSGLAHEIRNPLNAMNLNLQMLEEEIHAMPGQRDEDFSDLLGSIKGEIKRLERLVNNFLLYSRPSTPRFEEADLNQVLREVARFLQADFDLHHVELELDLQPLLPTVEIDETQLKQAFMNLLVNARQILHSGGKVQLRSRTEATGTVLVEVEDDGPGIPAEAQGKIFDVFYSNRGGGTGLGLPIAQQIVKNHGGSIDVSSTEGIGTTFRIRIPRRQGGAPLPLPGTRVAT